MIHLDSTFIIDFLRETHKKQPGAATEFLRLLVSEEIIVSVFAVCELLAGVHLSQQPEEGRSVRLEVFHLAAARQALPQQRLDGARRGGQGGGERLLARAPLSSSFRKPPRRSGAADPSHIRRASSRP